MKLRDQLYPHSNPKNKSTSYLTIACPSGTISSRRFDMLFHPNLFFSRYLNWGGILFFTLTMCFVGCSDLDDERFNPKPVVIDNKEDSLGKVVVQLAPYYNNKKAAISITFDDGMKCHFDVAALALEARGFRGTFFVNGRNIFETRPTGGQTITQSEARYMSECGHEISNHTFNHINVTKVSEDSLRKDLAKNDSLIELWTGKRPVTMAFPFNARNPATIQVAKEGRVGVRTFEKGFGGAINHSKLEDMVKWAETKIAKEDWGVAMLHGINEGYDGWDDAEPFFHFLDYLKSKEDELWVGIFRDVCAYQEEVSIAQLHVILVDGVLKGYAECSLDVSLFNHPLTLVISVEGQESIIKDIMPNEKFEFDLKKQRILSMRF